MALIAIPHHRHKYNEGEHPAPNLLTSPRMSEEGLDSFKVYWSDLFIVHHASQVDLMISQTGPSGIDRPNTVSTSTHRTGRPLRVGGYCRRHSSVFSIKPDSRQLHKSVSSGSSSYLLVRKITFHNISRLKSYSLIEVAFVCQDRFQAKTSSK